VRFLKLLYIDREKPNNLIKVEVPTEDGMQATQLSGRGLPEPSCDDHILSGKTVGKNLVGPSAPAASVFRMTHKPPPRVMAEKVSRAISPVNFCIRGTGGNNAGSPSCHPTEFEGPTFLRRLLQGPVDNANLPKTVDAAEDDWLRQEFDARVANNIEKYIAESSSVQNEGGKLDLQGANNIGVRAEAQSDDEEERDAISLRQPVIRVSQRQSVSTGADDAPVNVTAIQAGPTSTTQTCLLLWWGVFLVDFVGDVPKEYLQYIIGLMLLSLYWIMQFFHGFMSYVVGGCFVWYFARHDSAPLDPSRRVLMHIQGALTCGFGSLCKGGLVVPPSNVFLKLNSYWAQQRRLAQANGERTGPTLGCCQSCTLWCGRSVCCPVFV
jgi:hypothetical protein